MALSEGQLYMAGNSNPVLYVSENEDGTINVVRLGTVSQADAADLYNVDGSLAQSESMDDQASNVPGQAEADQPAAGVDTPNQAQPVEGVAQPVEHQDA